MNSHPVPVSLIWASAVVLVTAIICLTVLVYNWPWRRSH